MIDYTARLREGRLLPVRQRDLLAFEVFEIIIEEAQPLLRVVVAVEVNQRVGWMIVALVESLELLVGQVRDLGRVTAESTP